MKKLNVVVSALFISCLATHAFADLTTNQQKIDPLVTKSLSSYKVCDAGALATQLSKEFSVVYMPDDIAAYNYYLVRNSSEMNADSIRKATCQYIIDNACFLYWGNVANMAMFSQQKAAWFPADTSPHYMLSPLITCNKLSHKK